MRKYIEIDKEIYELTCDCYVDLTGRDSGLIFNKEYYEHTIQIIDYVYRVYKKQAGVTASETFIFSNVYAYYLWEVAKFTRNYQFLLDGSPFLAVTTLTAYLYSNNCRSLASAIDLIKKGKQDIEKKYYFIKKVIC